MKVLLLQTLECPDDHRLQEQVCKEKMGVQNHEFKHYPWVYFQFGPLQARRNGATCPPLRGPAGALPVFVCRPSTSCCASVCRNTAQDCYSLPNTAKAWSERCLGDHSFPTHCHNLRLRDRRMRALGVRYRATMGGTAGPFTQRHNLRARTQPSLTERSAQPTPPGGPRERCPFFGHTFHVTISTLTVAAVSARL